MADEQIQSDAEFLGETLALAQRLGCKIHEEKKIVPWEIASRFTLILPDTRLISVQRMQPRGEALLAVLRAAAPYLEKISRENNCCQTNLLATETRNED